MQDEKRKMAVERPIRVMSYETDYMRIVSNIVYVKWFEDLRTAILDEHFPLADMLRTGHSPILAETRLKYKRPITMDDSPVGLAWLEELRGSRWVARFEISVGAAVHCEGRQVGYYYNLETKRPERFPEEFLASWEKM